MDVAETQRDPWTVARLLAWTRDYFRQHGLESPRLCAELLLAHALGCERIELYTRYELQPSDETLAAFRESVVQAADGRPIAYLTGCKDFFSLTFEVTPDVLIPRPETEVLVERTIRLVRDEGLAQPRILDIGTGSGCIAIALAKHLPDARLHASDVSAAALNVAQRNAQRHGVAERIELRCGDLFDPWPDAAPFDLVVSNPPYVATAEAASLPRCVREFEPQQALFAGSDGLSIVRRLVAEAPARLRPDGHLLFEVAWNQSAGARAVLDESRWSGIVTYRDHQQHERVVHARRRPNAVRAAC
ncbi:MAG: peptide chain release factor N(5)-glutamine methyltransferase [Phycisphaerae bacterium]|jgi:release factor glutamine methyltransferase